MKNEFIKDISLLYVEDNEETRGLCEHFLKKRIQNVLVASNGQDGYKLYLKHKPDLIVTDIKTPLISGLEISSMIRDDNKDIPIIVISAYSDLEYFQEAINISINTYLMKPIDLTQLYCTIKITTENILLKKQNAKQKKIAAQKTYELEDKNNELAKSIHALKQTQKELSESNKMASLGELVAGMTHEINTPIGMGLTSSTYFLQITEDIRKEYESENISKDEFEHYLDTSEELAKVIYINLKRTAQLVKSFKQVAVDQTNDDKRKFNFKQYLEEILLSLNSVTKKTNIKFEINCDEDIVIYSYPGAYSQIFSNLILNSIKHGYNENEKGIISIEIIKKEDVLTFIYKDDGKGVSSENLTKVFDRFFTTGKDKGGTGLGLNIVHSIVVDKLKGSIDCRSEEGKGITFEIIVPLFQK